ncbi:hypothetical protein M3Y98_00036100 [Aphelenchoides besseyi]|nr:hypothetical protein M3Y98_00036100 [Aphelenchoides besseyi]
MRLRLFLLLFSAVFLQVNAHQFLGKRPRLSTSTNDDDDKERLRERLPRVVDVYHYDLQLTPYFPFPGITARQDFTFDGIVTMYFQIIEQTKSIWFYSQGLNSIDSVVLKQGNHQLTLEAYATDLDLNRVAITPIEVFKVGQNYSLTISYNAPINDYGNAGLYYVKMYPSFDDPHMKATFQLTLIYPSQAKIYHNVEEKVSEDLEGTEHKRTTFAVTPKMSTYLLAFVIGNFEFRNATTKRGISVRSIGIPEISAYLDESAGIAANCIDSMESLVNVNYAFKKLDNVEMIEMGHSSAMENIALIVYTRFLSQLPIATPTSLKFTQTSIICHEISHQWFGDLVTADYWGHQVSPNADTKHWNIPIFVFNINTNSSHPTYPFFLQSDQSLCPNDPQLNSSQLLIFNHKSLTFARFRYSAAYWDRLLSSDLRNVDDQTLLGLVLDAMADEDYSLTALKDRRSIPLIQKIIKERSGKLEPHILAVLVNKYLEYEGLFVGTNDQDLYGHLLKNQLQTVYETTDPLKSGFVNYVLLQVAVRYDIGDARTIAKTLFQTLTSLCPIVADSRPAVYCAGVRDNDATAMQYLISYWQKLIDSSDTKFYFQYELHAVAEGLSCITDTTQINKLLDIALDKNRPEMLQALANHPTASEVILQYIQSNLNKFKPKLSLFDIALRAMISTWYRKEDLDKIVYKATKATNTITLNSHRQLITSISVQVDGTDNPVTFTRDFDNAVLTLTLQNALTVGASVNIQIIYVGLLFKTTEQKQQGVNFVYSNILVTLFSNGAYPRSLVPSFDEPKYKAVWNVVVYHPSSLTALSNQKIASIQKDNKYTATTFAPTTKMSSYLLAIAIGKFQSISGVTNNGIDVRVWAAIGQEVYVPGYSGAMENWGLIIGDESYVLFNPAVHSIRQKRHVYDVVAHETVHQPASVLYMLRTLIGEDNFMRALSSYITNNREGNADDSTLWNEFQNASYPILMVTKNGDKIEVRQESYYPAAALPPSDYRYEWNIPVFSGNSSSVNSVQWLKNNSVLTYSDSFNFVVNRERISYSRVLYDDSTWDPIEDAYLNGQLNETIRAQILTDNYALITRGDVSYIRVLNLLHSLSTENNELPWTYAIEILNDLLRRLKTTKEHDILTNLCLKQLDFSYVPDARRAILCSGLQKFPEYEPNVKSILLHLSRQSGGFVSNRAEPYVEGFWKFAYESFSYVQNSLSGTFADVGAALIQRIGELDQTLEVLYNAIVYDIRVAVQSKHFELAVNTLAADWSTPQRLEQFQSIQWGGLTEKQQLAVTNAVNLIKKNIDWRLKNFKDVSNWILGQ